MEITDNTVAESATNTERAKGAITDTRSVIGTVARNPLGAMSILYQDLGRLRALGVGLVLIAGFTISLAFILYHIQQATLGPFAQSGIGPFFKMLVGGVVPAASLCSAIMLVRLICRVFKGPASDVFLTGIALLPVTAFQISTLLLGTDNYLLLAAFGVFALCYFLFLLFSGMTRLAGMSESRAAFVIPIVLIATAVIAKVVYQALLGM